MLQRGLKKQFERFRKPSNYHTYMLAKIHDSTPRNQDCWDQDLGGVKLNFVDIVYCMNVQGQ